MFEQNEIEQNAIWVKIDLLKEANRHSFALVYRKFMFQSKMEMESDVTTRNILATILMFRSRENISCPEFIRYVFGAFFITSIITTTPPSLLDTLTFCTSAC